MNIPVSLSARFAGNLILVQSLSTSRRKRARDSCEAEDVSKKKATLRRHGLDIYGAPPVPDQIQDGLQRRLTVIAIQLRLTMTQKQLIESGNRISEQQATDNHQAQNQLSQTFTQAAFHDRRSIRPETSQIHDFMG
jgi:hypothetical protein